jgi:hypothetical protein
MYRPDFRKPILDAFFLTASVGRPSSSQPLLWTARKQLEPSGSSLVHDPFILVLAILWLLFPIPRGLTRGKWDHRPVPPRCIPTLSSILTHQKGVVFFRQSCDLVSHRFTVDRGQFPVAIQSSVPSAAEDLDSRLRGNDRVRIRVKRRLSGSRNRCLAPPDV